MRTPTTRNVILLQSHRSGTAAHGGQPTQEPQQWCTHLTDAAGKPVEQTCCQLWKRDEGARQGACSHEVPATIILSGQLPWSGHLARTRKPCNNVMSVSWPTELIAEDKSANMSLVHIDLSAANIYTWPGMFVRMVSHVHSSHRSRPIPSSSNDDVQV